MSHRRIRLLVTYSWMALLLLLLTACAVPRFSIVIVQPTLTPPATPTRTPTLTPGPSETPAPTLCAHARVSGQVCVAHAVVRISACCPEWYAETNADEVGVFEFDNLTAGAYTVSAAGRSWDVTLNTCYSQASVNLCPPPTHPPLGR